MTRFAPAFQLEFGCAQPSVLPHGYMTLDACHLFVMERRLKFGVAVVIELELFLMPALRRVAFIALLVEFPLVLVLVAVGAVVMKQFKGRGAERTVYLSRLVTGAALDGVVFPLQLESGIAIMDELEVFVSPALRHMARRAALGYFPPVLVLVAVGTGGVLHPPKLGAAEDFLPPRYVALCALHCLVFAFQAV